MDLKQLDVVGPLGQLIGPSPPPDPAALFSEGGEVIKLHIEGSLTIPAPDIKREDGKPLKQKLGK